MYMSVMNRMILPAETRQNAPRGAAFPPARIARPRPGGPKAGWVACPEQVASKSEIQLNQGDTMRNLFVAAMLSCAALSTSALAGEVTGTASVHTAESIQLGLDNAQIGLPGQPSFVGLWKDAPAVEGSYPVVILLHGSSGNNPKLGYDAYQAWLADNGIASVMFDGMQLPDRIMYKSPVDKEVYEKIHALRASEIEPVLERLAASGWADSAHLVLAGTSEGSVPVARNGDDAFAARIIYSWSCEDNYFVSAHETAVKPGQPVLNVNSDADKYFSSANEFIGNADAVGHCGPALAENPNAEVVLIPGAPHTLFNLPAARDATLGFLKRVLAAPAS